eukprot:839284_1
MANIPHIIVVLLLISKYISTTGQSISPSKPIRSDQQNAAESYSGAITAIFLIGGALSKYQGRTMSNIVAILFLISNHLPSLGQTKVTKSCDYRLQTCWYYTDFSP